MNTENDPVAGLNTIHNCPDLGSVSMPIIRIMGAGGLSWSNMEDCATALRAIYAHWRGMEAERHMLNQRACEGSAGGSLGGREK